MATDRRPVGLLLDTVHDNTGDKAIRLVMEDFFQHRGINYEVLSPLAYGPALYSHLVVGGGHLIREPEIEFFRAFRPRGRHILNAVGVLAGDDLDYLDEYAYVSVRSEEDRRRLRTLRAPVAVVPCVGLALEPDPLTVTERRVGLHVTSETMAACPDLLSILTARGLGPVTLVPFTHWLDDSVRMEALSSKLRGSVVAPYLQPRQLRTLIGGFELMISSSLHACMFAYAANVPFLAFDGARGKIREFCADRGLGEWVFRNDIELATILDVIGAGAPDYSRALELDRATLDAHFRRLEDILKPPAIAVSPANSRWHEIVRQRDFAAARHLSSVTVESARDLDQALSQLHGLQDEREDLLPDAETYRAVSSTRSYRFLRRTLAWVDRLRFRGAAAAAPAAQRRRGADATRRSADARLFTLYPPRIDGQRVHFSWHVEPSTDLYNRESFYFEYPEGYDPSLVPERLWWTVFMTCLHPHWALLRPCEVRLPIRLQPGEGEVWSRLVDAAVNTLEAHAGGGDYVRGLVFVEGDRCLPQVDALTDGGRCATSFSSGKDSLTQAALLSELTTRPLLVSTRAPIPGIEDHHVTPRRSHVFSEIVKRRDLELIEVESDLRTSWDLRYSLDAYGIPIQALTDTNLFFSSLVTAGYLSGATHLFMASEQEVQQNAVIDGRIIQHQHFMYSAVTQRTLARLIAPLGLSFGSLTWSLHAGQVQELLARRYPDLRDLQYSCSAVRGTDTACNRCAECLNVGLRALALGYSPTEIGVDAEALFINMRAWRPKLLVSTSDNVLPGDIVTLGLAGEKARSLQAISTGSLAAVLDDAVSPRGREALSAFAELKAALQPYVTVEPGFNPYFLELVDPLLQPRLAAIYGETFTPDDSASARQVGHNSDALVAWITEPLGPATEPALDEGPSAGGVANRHASGAPGAD